MKTAFRASNSNSIKSMRANGNVDRAVELPRLKPQSVELARLNPHRSVVSQPPIVAKTQHITDLSLRPKNTK